MFTLDEMSVLSKRIFFNSLTYQANKLLEKVNISLLQLSWTLDIGLWLFQYSREDHALL